MWLWLTTAHASCIALAPGPTGWVRQRELAPDAPLVVASDSAARALRRRLRVRGPDGALIPTDLEHLGDDLRLVPHEPWPIGPLQIEELTRVPAVRGDPQEAWFALQSIEVVFGPQPELAPPGPVTWTRSPRGRGSELIARFDAPADAVWVELEVLGVGPIAQARVIRGAPTGIGNFAPILCNDTHELLPLGPDGDVTARVVVHADGGRRAEGPWTVVGPRVLDGASLDPVGRPADVDDLVTWVPISVAQDPAPVTVIPGGCGGLSVTRTVAEEVPTGTHLVVDGDLRLRRVERRDGLYLDGAPIPGVDGTVRGIVARGRSLWVAVDGRPSTVLALRDGVTVGALPLGPESLSGLSRSDDGLLIAELPGRHLVLTEALAIVAELNRSNLGVSTFHGAGGTVQVETLPGGWDVPQRLTLLGEDGAARWTRELPPRARVDQVAIDAERVAVGFDEPEGDGQSVVLAWDRSGEPTVPPTGGWIRSEATPAEVRAPWGARTLVRTSSGVVVEDEHARWPPLPGARGALVGLGPDGLEQVSVREDRSVSPPRTLLTRQILGCTGLGAPALLR